MARTKESGINVSYRGKNGDSLWFEKGQTVWAISAPPHEDHGNDCWGIREGIIVRLNKSERTVAINFDSQGNLLDELTDKLHHGKPWVYHYCSLGNDIHLDLETAKDFALDRLKNRIKRTLAEIQKVEDYKEPKILRLSH